MNITISKILKVNIGKWNMTFGGLWCKEEKTMIHLSLPCVVLSASSFICTNMVRIKLGISHVDISWSHSWPFMLKEWLFLNFNPEYVKLFGTKISGLPTWIRMLSQNDSQPCSCASQSLCQYMQKIVNLGLWNSHQVTVEKQQTL